MEELENRFNAKKARLIIGILILIVIVEFIFIVAIMKGFSLDEKPYVYPRRKHKRGYYASYEYKKMERDLHTLNLVNNLYLSKEQMNELLPLVEESKKLDEELEKVNMENSKGLMKVIAKIKKQLMVENSIDQDLQDELDKYQVPIYKKLAEIRKKKRELIEKVKTILNPNQIKIIEAYEPCIVPNEDASDPERIGGTVPEDRFMEILEKIRKMPEDKYQQEKDKILKQKWIMMDAYNTDQQKEAVLSQMENAMDKARKLSDEEFEIQKKELAKIAMPTSGPPWNSRLDEFIDRFLLNPFMIEYIKAHTKEK